MIYQKVLILLLVFCVAQQTYSITQIRQKLFANSAFVTSFLLFSQNVEVSPFHSPFFKQTKRSPLVFANPSSQTAALKMSLQENESKSISSESLSKESPNYTSIYVHIPYCRKRCHYCDFAIVPIGSVETNDSNSKFHTLDEQYTQAVLDEIQLSTNIVNDSFNNSNSNKPLPKLRSIYFGGGTPSLASISTLESILQSLNRTYGIMGSNNNNNSNHNFDDGEEKAEITIEMDPGTFSKSKLHSILEIGFNRISLGIQSFHDPTLERIGRAHRKQDIMDTIQMIQEEEQEFGYQIDISIDLISGLPGVSLAQWVDTLEFAANVIQPDHMSVYDLQVEEGTRFGKWYANHDHDEDENYHDDLEAALSIQSTKQQIKTMVQNKNNHDPLPNADDCAFMYRYASGYLKAKGYEHYEISSYAKKRKRSKHNSNYWRIGSEWHAVGLGATSCFNGIRYARPRAFSDYINWVNDQVVNGNKLPEWHRTSENNVDDNDDEEDETLAEIVMTRLRTSDGLDLKWVEDTYGKTKVEKILRGMQLGLDLNLAVLDKDQQSIKLRSPDGFLFSNTILSSVFAELS